MIDIVVPDSNEAEFIAMAEKLGYDCLCFICAKDIDKLQSTTKIKLFNASLKLGKDLFISKANDDIRTLAEKTKPDLIYDLEYSKRADYMHQKNSGLDHVVCPILKTDNIIVCFSFSSLLDSLNQPEIIGRIRQNIKLCRKFKCSMAIASFAKNPFEMRSPSDLQSLFKVLGMHASEAKNSMSTIKEKIMHNLDKKSGKYIAEGIELAE